MKQWMRMALAALTCAGVVRAKEPVDYVNTKIGNISHMLVPVFPAVQRPNGLLRVTPPNESFLTERIEGIPLQVPSHRQGQVFLLMPAAGADAARSPDWHSRYDHAEARPDRYSVFLDDHDALFELAPGRRAALAAVTFERAGPRAILLRPKQKGALRADGATVSGTDDYHGVTVYLHAEFDTPPARADSLARNTLALVFPEDVKTVRMRYAVSYVSSEQAEKNLRAEIRDFNLDRLAKGARDEWNQTLGRIRVAGGTEDERAVFYTALYRSHERMVNISEDGRYFSAWDSTVHEDGGVPFWTDDWSWDTYHALHPLNVLLHPAAQNEKLASYIRMCEQSGWMPTFPTVFGDAHCMNGQHPVALFLDAWRKGVRGFDAEKAYAGIKKTMLEESLIPWHRGAATELDRFYWEKGYLPALKPGEPEPVKEVKPGERRQAVAVTLAASYDNWCLAQFAQELGKTEDHAFFLKRSYDYRNLWRKDTGFFHPKDRDGNWIEPFDYKYAGGQGARDYYDENNAWTYIWEVYHNVDDLIALFGGRPAFNAKLDRLFDEGPGRPRWEFYNALPDSTGLVGMFVMGNEPSFHIPYLYNFSGEPWKTQKRVRMLMESWFRNDLMGICGDEDGGGMSAFAVFTAMGFYPVTAGVPAYAFGSPLFREVSVRLENGKTFVLQAPKASRENKYIQSVKVNGRAWDKTWFPHDVLAGGGRVVLEMGDRPNKAWGAAPGAAPFSEGAPR
ncbi:MAG: GH92 family glycosyl hydrolase [Verrucomicrobiota bacterium]|jgi:predicted alpha-1,2-mannosidase|nr:GH92 family glycosyl hydrolase [Verrucomicrobiota bacterium]